ncbi:nucleotidyltransferase domain-containing protein [Thermodesulfovibrio hydrogeniphilus]
MDFEKLKAVFEKYPYIASAYLFGSYASGKFSPMSDIDIAVLLKEPYPKGRELIHTLDFFAYKIEKTLNLSTEVDLIDMNSKNYL